MQIGAGACVVYALCVLQYYLESCIHSLPAVRTARLADWNTNLCYTARTILSRDSSLQHADQEVPNRCDCETFKAILAQVQSKVMPCNCATVPCSSGPELAQALQAVQLPTAVALHGLHGGIAMPLTDVMQ